MPDRRQFRLEWDAARPAGTPNALLAGWAIRAQRVDIAGQL